MSDVKRYIADVATCVDVIPVESVSGAKFVLATDYATLEAENAKLRAELERTATWIEDLPVPTVGAAGQLVRIDKVLAAAPSAPKADDPVKQMLLEALEKVDREHEILGWMKACELRRGRGSFGIAVMSDELALDWQSHQKNLERLIELRHAAIAAARKGEGE